MAEPFKLLFNEALITDIAQRLHLISPHFDHTTFLRMLPDLTALEMKQRIRAMTATLHAHLPADFAQALPLLQRAFNALPMHNLPAIRGFALWIALQFVEDYGLSHLALSMAAMYEWTQRFSAEFAIRPFLMAYPEQTFHYLQQWVNDPSPDVRRLVSEGTRPRLPWGKRLPAFVQNPTPILALLEALIEDPSLYVRKSVANNLNDVAKDHPEQVIDWLQSAQAKHPQSHTIAWIIRHSCRSLIKAGHKGALTLLGFTASPAIVVNQFSVNPTAIALSEKITFYCEIASTAPETQHLVIDYLIHFQKNKGVSPRIIKGTKRSIQPNETVQLTKQHAVVPVTVRRYYSGEHRVELQINGMIMANTMFHLTV